MLASSPAIAQDRGEALDAWKGCLLEKAATYATLESSMTEVVEASAGACLEQRVEFQSLQTSHHESNGTEFGRAVQLASDITDDIEVDLLREAMSIVAELRTN